MCQILVFKRTKIGVLGEVCKDLLKIFFSGALPPDPFSGNSSPDLLFAQAAKGFSFLSHERKKRNKESSPAARISLKMEHGRLKTQKLGASLLKQFVFLYAFRTPFS